ncbi:acyltransferase [Sandaracinus amylolyticus]|uniref:acyltransferase n=1 Tax=Sandaracinus amylolyticus TaxID=927083 RepID=UPI001F41B95A|nr:acyltransferase [Sandaracinus amylolyticus]UJR82737.1 Hypothetical protein I5071_48020 [Sandaracinus amylolyticus]
MASLRSRFRAALRTVAVERGIGFSLYQRLVSNNDGRDNAEYLRRHGGLHSMGRDVMIVPGTTITDPAYTRIGNNVVLSKCALIGHDGSIGVLSRAYNRKLDRVGKIDIRDNVFIGFGAIVMPGITIGPDAIVAAGAVVTRNVEPGTIVAGVPARDVGRVAELVDKLERESRDLPWWDLLARREGDIDPALEPELVRRRVAAFYGRGDAE